MRVLCATLFATTLLAASPATSQVLDLSTIKCGDFISSSKENIGIVLAWMNAYYKDEDDPRPSILPNWARRASSWALIARRTRASAS